LRKALGLNWWQKYHAHVYALVGIGIALAAWKFTASSHGQEQVERGLAGVEQVANEIRDSVASGPALNTAFSERKQDENIDELMGRISTLESAHSQPTSPDRLDRAFSAIKESNWRGARDLVPWTVVDEETDAERARVFAEIRSLSLVKLERTGEAIPIVDWLIERYPGNVDYKREKAWMLLSTERPGPALLLLTEAAAADPTDVDTLANSGIALMALEHYDQSLQAFEDALAAAQMIVDPVERSEATEHVLVNVANCRFLHAQELSDAGDKRVGFEGVVDAVTRAETLGELAAETENLRGAALWFMGKSTEALSSFGRASKKAPMDASYHYNRGVVLEALGREQEALDTFLLAVSHNPSSKRYQTSVNRVRARIKR
jgi:tetratricopeptide (TPR) repeat protein